MQPPDFKRGTFILAFAVLLCGSSTVRCLSGASNGNTSGIRKPEVVELPAGPGSECLSEAGAYYGSDCPPTTHSNASSPEACCKLCQSTADCAIWNWCGDVHGCLYPNLLADADGRIGVGFRVCDLKARPVTVSGTTPMPPDTVRTGDMAGWTSGIPVASRLLQDLPGYSLYKAAQMPFGQNSADFACAQSYTSKQICELPGNLTAAADVCGSNPECHGFQFCFLSPGAAGSAAGRIRLKSALNISDAIYNPYCSVYVSEAPSSRVALAGAAVSAAPPLRRLQQDSNQANYFFDPLMGTATTAPAPTPALSNPGLSTGGGAARRPNQTPIPIRPKGSTTPASPDLDRPSIASAGPAPGAAPGNSLDDLLGGSAPSPGSHFLNNTIVAVEAPPGLAQNYASSGQQHSFDALQGASIGISAQPTVTINSEGYNADSSIKGGVGSSHSDDTITPADGITPIIQSSRYDRRAGPMSNRTATPTASVLMPLDYGYPMQIFPGATFRFGLCQKVTPSVYLRVDLMSVPSLRKDNASAYAIHVWGQVPVPTNATCSSNKTCVFELVEDAFFNLEDSVITRARHTFVTTQADLLKVPVGYQDSNKSSTLVAPMVHIPYNEVSNTTTEHGLRFHILKENTTAYINELTQLYYYVSQVALGNKHCSPGFPGLNIVMDYLQSVLQVQVTEATGQNFGTFATINGVPLAFNLVTAANLAAGARRGFAQSCLTESNTVYQGQVLVAGASNLQATAEDCCQACWMYGGQPHNFTDAKMGPVQDAGGNNRTGAGRPATMVQTCNAWNFCTSAIGCSSEDGTATVERGFCELKYSRDVAAHQPVTANRAAAGFLSGRTTAVLPAGARNLFGDRIV
ncbi:g159 [Coccomyxa viridis]|uniref:G159 protein n=1 Tax=Coccomyxa viridis TaxID=1274662 RepID=A0ABP1FH08_9CHLO